MKTIFTLSLIIALLTSVNCFAQKQKSDSSFIVSGKVINPESLEGISFAHIKIANTYWGIVCDSLGFFRLRINPNQKLRISAIGYKEQVVSIKTPKIEDEVFQEIKMEQESYLLQEVNIYSLGTWSDFKENFIKTDLPKKENIAETFDFGNLKMDRAMANSLKRGGFGFSFGFNRKKAKGIHIPTPIEQLHNQFLEEKYNRELVAKLTNESGKRLNLLLKYINTNAHFTYQTSDYFIGNKIKQLYKDFLHENPNWEYEFTYTDTLGLIPNHLRP
ncbi:carboxypeptidase-like regulatory domain-containing protein [Ancylomarina longa]|uniref:carboxypeptidase-like regulatory domain-containing protein n=1 Tax=Ancylomarina longa TaxID=2487017 RepID=UPI001ADE1171|nr:carboxypeptidase-like regulatory domain-containing protein [Ancylomarina longa]